MFFPPSQGSGQHGLEHPIEPGVEAHGSWERHKLQLREIGGYCLKASKDIIGGFSLASSLVDLGARSVSVADCGLKKDCLGGWNPEVAHDLSTLDYAIS